MLFLLAFALPIGYAVYQSVMDVEYTGALGLGGSHSVFVGLANYSDALSDHAFLRSIGRPVDIEELPDGSIVVSDDAGGRIWRISR